VAAVFFVYCVKVFTAVIFANSYSPTCNCNDTVGCGLWVWNGLLCWMVTVLWAVGLERIVVLDGNCAVGCGSGTDCCVGW
jgi:hypothetical protein